MLYPTIESHSRRGRHYRMRPFVIGENRVGPWGATQSCRKRVFNKLNKVFQEVLCVGRQSLFLSQLYGWLLIINLFYTKLRSKVLPIVMNLLNQRVLGTKAKLRVTCVFKECSTPFQNDGRLFVGIFRSDGRTPLLIVMSFGNNVPNTKGDERRMCKDFALPWFPPIL